MSNYDLKNHIFKKVKIIGDKCLLELKEFLRINKVKNIVLKENEISFLFWGLDFKVKTEIMFQSGHSSSNKGELNTYLIDNEKKEKLVFQYSFDKLGNIGRLHVVNDFSEHYFFEFIEEISKSSNNIKFQLK